MKDLTRNLCVMSSGDIAIVYCVLIYKLWSADFNLFGLVSILTHSLLNKRLSTKRTQVIKNTYESFFITGTLDHTGIISQNLD